MALPAFDLSLACWGKIFEIRVNEVKSGKDGASKFLERISLFFEIDKESMLKICSYTLTINAAFILYVYVGHKRSASRKSEPNGKNFSPTLNHSYGVKSS